MTVAEAIALVDGLKPNKFSKEDKVKWLSDIDGLIVRELIDTHEDSPLEYDFEGYRATPGGMREELIAPYPYDILYRWYLESQIDLYNMEMDKYNNSAALYNSAYAAYRNAYNRSHMPVQRVERFRI